MKFTIGFEKEDAKKLHGYWDEIIATEKWTEGKFTRAFEDKWSEYQGLPSLSFGSWAGAALAALEFFDVRGKTVLCPSNTFMATPLSVIKAGGRVEFVDCNKVYDQPCHKILNRSGELPNTDWVASHHWCVPIYYKGE